VSTKNASWSEFWERLRVVITQQLAKGSTIDQVLDDIVLTSLSYNIDPAWQNLDADLIELGARFEPLVDRYYVARRRGSGSSARRRRDVEDTLHEMKRLANDINAASVDSIEGLRIKALVALWEIAPLCKGDTEFSFDDAYPFQHLFTAVAELCGLNDKIAATGCTLPDIGLAYDDADEDCDDDGEDA
jgi:hypothetical protein